MKRFIATYRRTAKCHKALQNARVKQHTPADEGRVNRTWWTSELSDKTPSHQVNSFQPIYA